MHTYITLHYIALFCIALHCIDNMYILQSHDSFLLVKPPVLPFNGPAAPAMRPADTTGVGREIRKWCFGRQRRLGDG